MTTRVRQLIRSGQTIEAIKVYRQQTGLGLKDAKDAVDAIARELAKLNPPSPMTHTSTPESPDTLHNLLASFAENLTAQVEAGSQSEVYQREAEVTQVLQALASPLKGRVVIIGPARAGKTAVALACARRIARGECPPELMNHQIWRLTPGSLPGLATPGNWQAALDQLLTEWTHHPEVILFIDEITRAARLPGGSDDEGNSPIDVATLLASTLKRSAGLCLAEAEDAAWHRFSETYTDYGRLFLPVRVEGQTVEVAREVVRRA
jgi:ATP-dependent Clp protease ATP-binding subunit ClpA